MIMCPLPFVFLFFHLYTSLKINTLFAVKGTWHINVTIDTNHPEAGLTIKKQF